MKERKGSERETGHSEILLKNIQYLMFAVLLGVAFFLPAHGAATRRKESGEVAVQNMIQREVPDESGSDAGKKERKTEEKGTIVLDSGHGGFDSGMVGASGVTERELNLIYAKKLEALLTEAGYRVVQTRTTQAGLYDEEETHKKAQDMQRRVAVIGQEKPLLAISIHQNSYPQDASVCGPQVFYYEHSSEGEQLAKDIQTCMNEQLEIARPRVQKGNTSYYILKRSAATTVIVECGFLTNPAEEEKLQEEAYQDRLVQAVCDGVLQYLKDGGVKGETQ